MKFYSFKILFVLILILALAEKGSCQDIHFSQFYENAILRNPALTGIFSGDYKAGVNYRTQWGTLTNPFQTVMVSVESRKLLNEDVGDYLSFGLSTSYDHAGAINFNSFQIYPAVNFNKAIEDDHNTYLSVGFAGGYIQRSVDMGKMQLDNQYMNGAFHSSNPNGEQLQFTRLNHFDLSTGVSINSSIGEENIVNYYIGAAAYHVTKPKESFNGRENFVRLSTKWTGNAGLQCKFTNQISAIFHLNYQNQRPYSELIGGGLLSWRANQTDPYAKNFAIHAGMFWRIKDAVIPTVKLDYGTYSFTMSYDVTTSSLRPLSSYKGGWELSIYSRGKFSKGALKSNPVKCPRFEGMLEEVW